MLVLFSNLSPQCVTIQVTVKMSSFVNRPSLFLWEGLDVRLELSSAQTSYNYAFSVESDVIWKWHQSIPITYYIFYFHSRQVQKEAKEHSKEETEATSGRARQKQKSHHGESLQWRWLWDGCTHFRSESSRPFCEEIKVLQKTPLEIGKEGCLLLQRRGGWVDPKQCGKERTTVVTQWWWLNSLIMQCHVLPISQNVLHKINVIMCFLYM